MPVQTILLSMHMLGVILGVQFGLWGVDITFWDIHIIKVTCNRVWQVSC